MHEALAAFWTQLAEAQVAGMAVDMGQPPGSTMNADQGFGCMVGQVTRTYRMGMDVHLCTGGVIFGTTDDKYRDPMTAPATGDWVIVTMPDQREHPLITRIDHRFTQLVRRDPADRALPQVMAANVDVVAVVHGADRPVNAKRLWRALAVAGGSGAEVVMILTKADLADGATAATQMAQAAPTVPLYVTASESGEGITALADQLATGDAVGPTDDPQAPPTGVGKTMVLVGESGAGKSSLVNALLNRAAVAVGAVRELDAKGRHTTTHRELLYLPQGGAVLDTPGVRAIGMWPGFVDCSVPFAEVAEATAHCKFANCTHRHEPGCGVLTGLADGTLNPTRVDACFELLDEEAQVARELETKHWR